MIRALADFWASRASYDAAHQRYGILHVTSVQENYSDVPNDSHTNASARKTLQIASAVAAIEGARADPRWTEVANGRYLPISISEDRYIAFDPSLLQGPGSGTLGSLPLLSYPALDLPITPAVRRHNYAAAAVERDINSMGVAPPSIAAATVGDAAGAAYWFQRNVDAIAIKPTFAVRTETPSNNTGYFLTASGGFLQKLEYGFTGLRIEPRGLVPAYPQVLPTDWRSLTLGRIRFRNRWYDLTVRHRSDGAATLPMNTLISAGDTEP